MADVDVIVVGGGLIGMLTARELHQRGASVMILERGKAGGESTWAGGGILSPLYPWRYPDAVNVLANYGYQVYPQIAEALLAESGIDPEYTRSGLLILDQHENDAARDWANRWHMPMALLHGDALHAQEPVLNPARTSALWLPQIAQLRNPRLVKSLAGSLCHRNIVLVVTRGNDGCEIYFKEGDVVFATSSCGDGRPLLEGLLKRSCRVPDQQVSAVLRAIERTGEPVDAVLARERLIDPKAFGDCLRRHTESEVFKIMAWRDGSFVFEKVTPPAFSAPVRLKVDDLLLEGARRSDEWLLIQQKIPNFGMVLEPLIADAAELTRRGMSPADVKVFSLVDGRRTVQEIIDTACLSDFDVAKSLFILLSVNLVRARK